MERALPLLVALLLVGCGGAPAPTEGTPVPDGASTPSPSGATPPGAFQPPVAAPGEVWTDVPEDVQAALRALSAKARPLVRRCADGPLKDLRAEDVAGGFAFDGPALDAACGEAGALFDAHVGLLGQSRSGDGMLSNLARLADDLDYLRRVMAPDQSASERGNAVNHVHDALRDCFRGLDDLDRGAIWPYHTVGTTSPDGWAHAVAGGHDWLLRLRENLDHLAYTQGTNPVMVRRRMLESFFVGAEVDGAVRARSLPALVLSPDEAAARKVYQDAETAALAALRATELAYVRGEILTAAARAEAIARADAALAAYEAAWKAETARDGPDPRPDHP